VLLNSYDCREGSRLAPGSCIKGASLSSVCSSALLLNVVNLHFAIHIIDIIIPPFCTPFCLSSNPSLF